MRAYIFLLTIFEIVAAFRRGGNSDRDDLRISTTSGHIHGKIDPELPHVRQFLGIPYAQPPTEDLRWQPPRLVSKPNAEIDATSLPPSCMQYFSTAIPNMFNQEILEFNVQGVNGMPTAISEDCLTLSIWTPATSRRSRPKRGSKGLKEKLLPVLVFIYGGGFGTGGTDIPYQIPAQWVERTPDHLVVSFNYRLNVFGFPNAAGLEQQNLGLLDQRLAIEWLKANVAAFGGDPERMVIWGQSAGGMSVDYYTFTYPDDPIVSGLIMDSGTAQTPFTSTDLKHTNFTFVAENVGCGGFGGDPAGELACMSKVGAGEINDFIAGYQGFEKTPGIAFVPVIDEEVVFANYSARALDGKQAKISAIIGTNREDGVPFANYRLYSPTGDFDQSLNELYYLSLFFCPQTETTLRRQQTGLKTFVYLSSGNFSNVSPKPWMGAYHSAELPMLMGTHANFRGKSSELEEATSRAMQDAWVAFAREGAGGLEGLGWSEYGSLGDADVRAFGADVAAKDVSVADVEARCNGAAPAM